MRGLESVIFQTGYLEKEYSSPGGFFSNLLDYSLNSIFFKFFTISKAPYYLIGSGIDRKVYIEELGTMRTWGSQS